MGRPARLSRHRSFPEAQWALSGEELDKIEGAYHQFEPQDRVNQRSWLFSDRAQLLSGRRVENWEARDAELLAMRRVAIAELLSTDNFEAIIRLATEAENPRWVGFAFGETRNDPREADDVLERTLGDPTRKIREFALGLAIALLQHKGREWSTALLSRARRENGAKKEFWTCCSPCHWKRAHGTRPLPLAT